jgi:subtilisin-like proprotein convertase family protein
MKNALLFPFVFFLALNISYSQYKPDSRIDSVVNLISQQRIKKYMRELTGNTMTTVNGIPTLIYSRFYLSPSNDLAAQYILEKFQSFGLYAYFQVTDSTCRNVIAVKTGTKFPNQRYMIGAHYDNILWPVNPGPYDTVHGADDNCSGVCGVLEAAKILAGMDLDYTVVFAAWDQEESGNVWGAGQYVDSAYARHDSIKGYINLDMLAWNSPGLNKFWAGPDSSSIFFQSIFSSLSTRLIPSFTQVYYPSENYGSDQLAFLRKGFHAFNVAEYNVNGNPNYHKITDTYANANIPYLASLLRPAIGMLTAFALNRTAYFSHKPLSNTLDTTQRSASVVINMPQKISTGSNSPRLYYRKSTEKTFLYVNSYNSSGDTLFFMIPGYPLGSLIYYYIAAQDTLENFVCTYPIGGSGLNPPGTTPPEKCFSYEIYSSGNYCSTTCPKPIHDMQITADTISVNQPGYVSKLSLNLTIYHQNDGDLIIQLLKPGLGMLNLSQRNGEGGKNYFYTTFDDNADISIVNGAPPFTGSYKPQAPLSTYYNNPVEGNWIIRVIDAAGGNQGTLAFWCLIFQIKTLAFTQEPGTPVKYDLSQNYPNPFNSSTRINYSIPKNSNVELKIYDMLGREVRTLVNEYQNAGNYMVMFNAGELASGVYFYKLSTDKFSETKKMLITK